MIKKKTVKRTGVTLKQYAIEQYFKTISEIDRITENGLKDEDKEKFIVLSVQYHSLKGSIPKQYWAMKPKIWQRRRR
jgi:hypothetical protein